MLGAAGSLFGVVQEVPLEVDASTHGVLRGQAIWPGHRRSTRAAVASRGQGSRLLEERKERAEVRAAGTIGAKLLEVQCGAKVSP